MTPQLFLVIGSILAVVFWYKKIDSETAIIYGIYTILINIIFLSAMTNI